MTHRITKEMIDEAKAKTNYNHKSIYHEHDDCIRIAYEWLDAQKKTKTICRDYRELKHIIEAWGKRYVSMSDVDVAAKMHPEITGVYPFYNISRKLILPSKSRLVEIAEAGTHETYGYRYQDVGGRDGVYKFHEV